MKRIDIFQNEDKSFNVNFFAKTIASLDKMCPHFHLSLQSGCDNTLKLMNRKYTSEEYMKSIEAVRKHFENPGISTDVMVGFSGETDEDFKVSCEFVRKVAFSKIHVFPYSIRRGTRAEKFDGVVPNGEKNRRCSEMIKIGEETATEFMKAQVGRYSNVLFEQQAEVGMYEGLTENYVRVMMASDRDISGEIIRVKIVEAKENWLVAECYE